MKRNKDKLKRELKKELSEIHTKGEVATKNLERVKKHVKTEHFQSKYANSNFSNMEFQSAETHFLTGAVPPFNDKKLYLQMKRQQLQSINPLI